MGTTIRRMAMAALAGLAAAAAQATVNVNTAQQSELQSVRGLDKVKAKHVIEYRNENGPYLSLEDLAKALGPDTVAKVESQVAFDGPAYVAPPRSAKAKHKARK